ncbi:MAG: hypothetical protein D3924_00105 [Candidatus Electrothrix sp. AR4]|nr:hypothetical protein [Candidatus Electrothrix sp. AR4]
MRSSFILYIIYSFFFTVIFCSSLFGQQSAMQPYNKKTFVKIYGMIESIATIKNPVIQKYGLHLTVKDVYSKKYFIHVCPQGCVELNKERFNFKKGEFITVSGSQFKSGLTENNMYASTIYRESSNLELRDPDTGRLVCCRPNIMESYSQVMLEMKAQFSANPKYELRDLLIDLIQQRRKNEFQKRSNMLFSAH